MKLRDRAPFRALFHVTVVAFCGLFFYFPMFLFGFIFRMAVKGWESGSEKWDDFQEWAEK